MEKEVVSTKQSITIMIMFFIGSTLILGGAKQAGRDAWAASILTGVMAVPMFLIYARIVSLFPGKDFCDSLRFLFGKIIGSAVYILYILFAFYLGSLVVRNFSEFVEIAALPQSPGYVFAICMVLTCIYLVKAGLEVMGRWCMLALPVILVIITLTLVLMLKQFNPDYLQPVFQSPIPKILDGAYSLFAFPVGESVIFLMFMDSFREPKKSYRVYFTSMIIFVCLFVLITLRNLGVMGMASIDFSSFPSYSAVSIIEIGDFLQRIEVIVAIVFVFCGLLKISVCLMAASKGVAKILNLNTDRSTIAPMALFMILVSLVVFKNSMEMFEGLATWNYFAFPFEVVLPILIWITAEIKLKKKAFKTPPIKAEAVKSKA